jgi:hypothetical protein
MPTPSSASVVGPLHVSHMLLVSSLYVSSSFFKQVAVGTSANLQFALVAMVHAVHECSVAAPFEAIWAQLVKKVSARARCELPVNHERQTMRDTLMRACELTRPFASRCSGQVRHPEGFVKGVSEVEIVEDGDGRSEPGKLHH